VAALRAIGVLAIGVLAIGVPALPASADDGTGSGAGPRVSASPGDGEVDVSSSQDLPGIPGGTSPSGADGAGGAGGAVERRLVLACPGSTPDRDPVQQLCVAAVSHCAWLEWLGRPGIAFRVFTRPAGSPPGTGWRFTGEVCLGATSTGPAAVGVPVVTLADLRRLPLPPGAVHLQPDGGWTLPNVPTDVFVDAPAREYPLVVLGQPVRVRVTAAGFRWSFGDGGVLVTADPGAPYPDLRTTHVFRRPGVTSVALTTSYRGEYAVAGGPWVPIEGTADVPSPPVSLAVVDARAHLVASPLPG